MEPLQLITPTTQNQPMTSLSLSLSLSSKLKLKRPNPFWFSSYSQLRAFSSYSPLSPSKPISASGKGVGVRAKVSDAQLKDNWLASLSCPFPQTRENFDGTADSTRTNSDSSWVIGVDPDLSGALALLKGDESGCSAQVYDSPHLKILVGKRVRRRLDAKSIVQLLGSFDAPLVAYIEQSNPYPQDGKQGWWSGGFGYGLWIGILVALGFSVVPVSSISWKNKFELTGGMSTKEKGLGNWKSFVFPCLDDSRRVASALFPSLSSMLKRKKDHGRAEALLIAAYGKGLKIKSDLSCNPEVLVPQIGRLS
ncbi:uncharacterized protein LOC18778541 isoform X2 [Prunus persica]|uniref:uncharacterized protein LOC18778541 isoform X2 n=1 Tax=Prunus persica TaxID=3760 RepID=UPI0009AB6E3D|nr:uncharacterized protein LOC18778541 isoform X2 [Prunus persica]